MRSNPAFALVAGERVEAFALARDLVGRSAPLNAGGDGTLEATGDEEPDGALALAALFLGPVSASGLRGLVQAFHPAAREGSGIHGRGDRHRPNRRTSELRWG